MAWPSLQFPSYLPRWRYEVEGDESQLLSARPDDVQAGPLLFPPYKNELLLGLDTPRGNGMANLHQVCVTQQDEVLATELRQGGPTLVAAATETPFVWPHQEQYGDFQSLFGGDVYAPVPLVQPPVQFQLQGDYLAGYNPLLPLPTNVSLPQEHTRCIQEPKERRRLCCEEGCKSQARALGRCKRHGGSKRCMSTGCEKSVQSRGLCIRHGGGSRCRESGCTRASQSFGKCKLHGGGRPCSVVGCKKGAHLKRLCRKHGGGIKCCIIECDKWAQRQGMCMKHVKELLPLCE